MPDRRVVRANTPPHLYPGDRTAAEGFGSSAGYLRSIGLDGDQVRALRRRVTP
ncbi:hypothetical protein ACFQ46_08385 [Kineococcus sp. GCM10028916]|uniref:hypothetical protein n=1 Tax=Kineococcus sp. GCM10028916 TaxID=3273394 RepID=UPI00362AC14E